MSAVTRKAALSAVAVAVSVLLLAPGGHAGAQQADQEAVVAGPLLLKLSSGDGKPRIRVARDLEVLVRCSRDCRANATLTLVTPIQRRRLVASSRISVGETWVTGIRLTRFGLRYLRKHHRESRLRVAIKAKDRVTGRVTKKKRVFRFHR